MISIRVFANGPGDLGSIPGRVIPKTQKLVLDASLLNTQHYKVRIKGKVEQSRERSSAPPTPRCSSYQKGNLRVTLDYGRELYFYLYLRSYNCLNKWLFLVIRTKVRLKIIAMLKKKHLWSLSTLQNCLFG